MLFPASRRSIEESMRELALVVLDVPISADCAQTSGPPCLHAQLLSIHREVLNALQEDASPVPYRTDWPKA